MNWPQFFKQWGELSERVNQLAKAEAEHHKQQSAAMASLQKQLSEAKSLQDKQRGAYKAAVAIGSLIGALVTIAARLLGLWH